LVTLSLLESQPRELSLQDIAALTPERLHARYARRIARHVWRVLGPHHEREDLVQEVLIAIFQGIAGLRDPACLDGWVTRVTANTLKGHLRRRALRQHTSWEGLPEPQMPWFESNVDTMLLASRAVRVIDRLPPSDRALLATLWFTSATLESIAADAGCAAITVRRRARRARSRFERLARLDPVLAPCLDETPLSSTPVPRDDSYARQPPRQVRAVRVRHLA